MATDDYNSEILISCNHGNEFCPNVPAKMDLTNHGAKYEVVNAEEKLRGDEGTKVTLKVSNKQILETITDEILEIQCVNTVRGILKRKK